MALRPVPELAQRQTRSRPAPRWRPPGPGRGRGSGRARRRASRCARRGTRASAARRDTRSSRAGRRAPWRSASPARSPAASTCFRRCSSCRRASIDFRRRVEVLARRSPQLRELHQERFLDEGPAVVLEAARALERVQHLAALLLGARRADERDREPARIEELLDARPKRGELVLAERLEQREEQRRRFGLSLRRGGARRARGTRAARCGAIGGSGARDPTRGRRASRRAPRAPGRRPRTGTRAAKISAQSGRDARIAASALCRAPWSRMSARVAAGSPVATRSAAENASGRPGDSRDAACEISQARPGRVARTRADFRGETFREIVRQLFRAFRILARDLDLFAELRGLELAAHGPLRRAGARRPGHERGLARPRNHQLRILARRRPEGSPPRVLDDAGEVVADLLNRERPSEALEQAPHGLGRLRLGQRPQGLRVLDLQPQQVARRQRREIPLGRDERQGHPRAVDLQANDVERRIELDDAARPAPRHVVDVPDAVAQPAVDLAGDFRRILGLVHGKLGEHRGK